VLVLGVTIFLMAVLVDTVRDVLGRAWPYIGGYGAIVMAMLLAVELALDFREKEHLLAQYREHTMRVRDELNTPLQVLCLGIELAAQEGTITREHIAPLQRALEKLTMLGGSLRAAATRPPA
jgi:hypothetical protein